MLEKFNQYLIDLYNTRFSDLENLEIERHKTEFQENL